MHLKKIKNKIGRTHLSIVQSYRTPEGKTRAKTILSIGYLDELLKTQNDPITYYTELAKQMTNEQEIEEATVTFTFNRNEIIPVGTVNRKSFGYAAISKLYHQLRIHEFFHNKQRHSSEQYDANAIMKLLVFMRLLDPSSKKQAYENKDYIFERTDFTLDDIYRCLSLFDRHKDTLMIWLHENIRAQYGRDTNLVYYDVTNYYFELDGNEGFESKKKDNPERKPDEFRKKGVSKEHRPDPIIQMGLFIDNNGIPITYKLFPGNTNDCMTYRPNLSDIKRKFGLGRAIVVADKGMNTGDNIWYTLSAKDGYVFSMSVRGANKEIKDFVLNPFGYEQFGDEYKRKSRLEPRTIHVTASDGGKIEKIVHEKQVVFYSEKYDKRAKAERASVLAKAHDMIKHPERHTRATSFGAAAYVKNVAFDKKTGKIINTGKRLEFDTEKLREQEFLDGYYMIVTSEHKESDDRIIEMYRGLWKIEESFKITKSELESRPVFVSTKEHIEGHFLTCFVALLLARVLEKSTSYKHSISSLLYSLGKSECSLLQRNYYFFNYNDVVLNDIGNCLSIDFSKKVRSLSEIKNILSDVKI